MHTRPRYALMRRILFPYSGEEVLSLRQCLRVIAAWCLAIPFPMSLCMLAFAALQGSSPEWLLMVFVFSLLSGVFIFGLLSVLIVSMSNRAARIHQAWKAQKGQQ